MILEKHSQEALGVKADSWECGSLGFNSGW